MISIRFHCKRFTLTQFLQRISISEFRKFLSEELDLSSEFKILKTMSPNSEIVDVSNMSLDKTGIFNGQKIFIKVFLNKFVFFFDIYS